VGVRAQGVKEGPLCVVSHFLGGRLQPSSRRRFGQTTPELADSTYASATRSSTRRRTVRSGGPRLARACDGAPALIYRLKALRK
jgi:hypothetical protein